MSGIALGWNIYRDCIDRPKIKIKAYVAVLNPVKNVGSIDVITKMYETSTPHCINSEAVQGIVDKINEPTDIIYVEVTNIGKKPIIISGHKFQLENYYSRLSLK